MDKNKIFANHIYLKRDLYPGYVKNFYNSITKRQTTQLKWVNKLNRHFSLEGTQMANKHVGVKDV